MRKRALKKLKTKLIVKSLLHKILLNLCTKHPWHYLLVDFLKLMINTYPYVIDIIRMRALCLITVKPGKVDNVLQTLSKIRKTVREVMIVTGRADVAVVLQGTIDEINNIVIDFKKIRETVTTETLIEVEVDLGW